MVDRNLGFRHVEQFVKLQTGKLKSLKLLKSPCNSKQIKDFMLTKLADAKAEYRETKKAMEMEKTNVKTALGKKT